MRTVVLSIAALDPGAGAGLIADLKTIEAHGCWGVAVATAITAQTFDAVSGWQPVEPTLISAQLEAVFRDFPVAAIKIGLLGDVGTVRAVADGLRGRSLPIILDPVLGSSSGTRFVDERGLESIREYLIPEVELITPNEAEALRLCGPTEELAGREALARRLRQLGANNVLITGGQSRGGRCEDLLLTPDSLQRIEHASVATRMTHGTGCVHSAALAARRANGETLLEAAEGAARFVEQALRHGVAFGSGGAPNPHWKAGVLRVTEAP